MGKRTSGPLDEHGLPRDPNEWAVDDWRDLHAALETVRRLVGDRHAGREAVALTCPHCKGTGRTTLSRAYAATWEKIKNRAGEFTAAMLAKSWGVPATRLNNQFAALERHGLLVSVPSGRERLYRVKGSANHA